MQYIRDFSTGLDILIRPPPRARLKVPGCRPNWGMQTAEDAVLPKTLSLPHFYRRLSILSTSRAIVFFFSSSAVFAADPRRMKEGMSAGRVCELEAKVP